MKLDSTNWVDWLKISVFAIFVLAGICAISECTFASKNHYVQSEILDKIYIPERNEYYPRSHTDSKGHTTTEIEHDYYPEIFRVVLENDDDVFSIDTTRRVFYKFYIGDWVRVGMRIGSFSGMVYIRWIDE